MYMSLVVKKLCHSLKDNWLHFCKVAPNFIMNYELFLVIVGTFPRDFMEKRKRNSFKMALLHVGISLSIYQTMMIIFCQTYKKISKDISLRSTIAPNLPTWFRIPHALPQNVSEISMKCFRWFDTKKYHCYTLIKVILPQIQYLHT